MIQLNSLLETETLSGSTQEFRWEPTGRYRFRKNNAATVPKNFEALKGTLSGEPADFLGYTFTS